MQKYSEDYPHTSAIIEFFYRPNSKKKRARLYFVPLK